mmetsp:Transcript_28091/g.97237  ORF Transcript_28091/g.97237 Transcript_28091/m.97237 type:complete len:271 (+) Transcript_28091:48-860(+)
MCGTSQMPRARLVSSSGAMLMRWSASARIASDPAPESCLTVASCMMATHSPAKASMIDRHATQSSVGAHAPGGGAGPSSSVDSRVLRRRALPAGDLSPPKPMSMSSSLPPNASMGTAPRSISDGSRSANSIGSGTPFFPARSGMSSGNGDPSARRGAKGFFAFFFFFCFLASPPLPLRLPLLAVAVCFFLFCDGDCLAAPASSPTAFLRFIFGGSSDPGCAVPPVTTPSSSSSSSSPLISSSVNSSLLDTASATGIQNAPVAPPPTERES